MVEAVGFHGGAVFGASAGFGRHGVRHEEHFFELAGDLTVEIDFAVNDDEAQRLLSRIKNERISVFYVRLPIEFGVVNGDS